jgi:PAT family beta-lactamase induction signal transducer AmpG
MCSFGPATPALFMAGSLAYSFANGIAYAAFTAFVLEMIGHGPGVATKYALLVGAANGAISYMTLLDGAGYGWGRRAGLLMTDAVATFVGVLLLGALLVVLRRSRAHTPTA